MSEFVFPDVKMGLYVLYSRDGSRKEGLLALVTRVKPGNKAVDLRVYHPDSAVGMPKKDCWHISDPRVETSKETFVKQPNRGVFEMLDEGPDATGPRLDRLEQIVRDQQLKLARMASLQQTVEQLGSTVAELEDKVAALSKPKRGPGRPRKVQPKDQGLVNQEAQTLIRNL